MQIELIKPDTARLAKTAGFWDSTHRGEYLWDNGENLQVVSQSLVQTWLRRNWNMDIVPVRAASALDSSDQHVLYLNGREYRHDGAKIVCVGYEVCLEIGLQLMIKRLIDNAKPNPDGKRENLIPRPGPK